MTLNSYLEHAWAERNHALGVTAAIARPMLAGHAPDARYEIATSFPPAFDRREQFWGAGPHRLYDYRSIGDGSYYESTTIVGGFGVLGIGMAAATWAASNAANNRRREAAARDMVPRWVEVDSGYLTVSSSGLYLQSPVGLHPWSWWFIDQAEMVGPGALHFSGRSAHGPVSWIIESSWSELVFITFAMARHPRHRQVLDGSWFPGGWHQLPRAPEPPRALGR